MITKYKVNELKPHPRNAEFFDDITGDKWKEFLESIKTLGVIEPLIVTPNKVIVSGHQRVKALKELGREDDLVDCVVRQYKDDDAVLLDLIETNIRQRGDVGGSAQKIGRRIKELERLYDIRQGAHTEQVPDESKKSQPDLMKDLGMSDKTYYKYRKLADMVPELSEAVDAGTVTQSAALAMMKQLSEDEQIELLSSLDATKKYTQKETEALINEIAELKAEPPKIVEKVVEKVPDDYQQIKQERDSAKSDLEKVRRQADGYRNDYNRERGELEKKNAELSKANDKLKAFEEADSKNARKKRQIDTGEMFNARVTRFIEEVAGYVWLTDEIDELPDKDRLMFARSIQRVKEWAEQMEYNIQNRKEKIE